MDAKCTSAGLSSVGGGRKKPRFIFCPFGAGDETQGLAWQALHHRSTSSAPDGIILSQVKACIFMHSKQYEKIYKTGISAVREVGNR
jgi:hypothetical protein